MFVCNELASPHLMTWGRARAGNRLAPRSGAASIAAKYSRESVARSSQRSEMTEPQQATRGPTEKGMEQRKLETSGSYEAPSRRAAHCASLSVILLSAGDRA